MKTRAILCLLYIVLFYGCKRETTCDNIGKKEIVHEFLTIDTISVNLVNSSFSGFSGLKEDNIYFLDKYFVQLSEIDIDGKITRTSMGHGRGPNEIPIKNPSAVAFKEEKLLLLGGTYDAYLYTNNTMERINIKVSDDLTSLNSSGAYSSFDELLKLTKEKFYYNIYSESKQTNPAEHSSTYFKNAHILMEVDLHTGTAIPKGHYSQYYLENHSRIKHLFQVMYDLDNNRNFHISYQADSLIYVNDENFEQKSVYGCAGINMDDHYSSPGLTWADFNAAWQKDISTKGYYYWLKYVEPTALLFRSYKKGAHSACDGLQIYNQGILIADLEVPVDFKVIGYIAPYYITQIVCDPDKETMKFYRFKL